MCIDGIGKTNGITGDKYYNSTGDQAGKYFSPTYNIELGYYKNDTHVNPNAEQKTVYQNFYLLGTGFDKTTNQWV